MTLDVINEISNYINNDNLEQALELILKNEENLKEEAEFWNLKGIICIKAQEYVTAIECLKKAININSKKSDYYYNLAYVLELQGIHSDSAIYYGLAKRYSTDEKLKNEISQIYDYNKTLLDIKKCAENSKKKTFIILSSCGFGEVLQRMHHISKALFKFGNEVKYISPTIETDVTSEKTSINTVVNYIVEQKRIIDGVEVYQPIRAIYDGRALCDGYMHIIQRCINESKNEVVLVAYMPYQVEFIKRLNGNFKVIYECVDEHSDLKYAFWGNRKDVLWEQQLMNISDAITTTAISLYLQRVSIEERKNVFLSRNAVNESDFLISGKEIPEDLKNIPEPRIVYTGAVYDWFNKELFYDVVKSNPDKSFVVIGFGNEEILKEKCSNLYFLGAKKHSDLKNYLSNCQIGIIPFRDDVDLIVNCDPIKQYEYISCGLPVITTYMPEAIINKPYTYIAKNMVDFNNLINYCLDLDIDKNKVQNFIIENSWDERARILCEISNGNITDDFRNKTNNNIEYNLEYICNEHDFIIFDALKAMFVERFDSRCALNLIEKTYKKNNKNGYVENIFLKMLLKSNKFNKIVEVVQKSKTNNISKEIIEELMYLQKNNNNKLLRIVCKLCVGKVNDFLVDISSLKEKNYKNIYFMYLRYFLGETLDKNEIKELNYSKLESPISKFLNNKVQTKIITIFIPTKDRTELLERCVNYFQSLQDINFKVQIYILDASTNKLNIQKNKMLSKTNENIRYFHFEENTSVFTRIEGVKNDIDTEYCCICADDDFLYKDGIIEAMNVLSENKEIITVKGRTNIFFDNNLNNIYRFPRDYCVSLLDNNPVERLKTLVNNWVPQLMYLIFRKNDLLNIIDHSEKYLVNNFEENVFKEYLFYFLVPLYGKIKAIDTLVNIRNESSSSGGYTYWGFFDCALSENFNDYYSKMKEAIIKGNKELSVKERDIDDIFKIFLVNSWGVNADYIKFIKSSDRSDFDLNLLREGFVNPELPYNNILFKINERNNNFIKIEKFESAINYMMQKNIINEKSRIILDEHGESFAHPQFETIVEILNKENIIFRLSTRGLVLPPKKNIYKNLECVIFSMYGFSKNIYEKMFAIDFEIVKTNIKETLYRLREGGFNGRAVIEYNIYQFNYNEINEARKFAEENSLEINCINSGILDYESSKLYMEGNLEYDELERIGSELILYPYQERKKQKFRRIICTSNDYLVVNEELQVELCSFSKLVIGNITNLTLEEIRKNKVNHDKCKECRKLRLNSLEKPLILY